ncbi:MAG: PASTA domain-containing protein, partial [Sandaracinaceae bacterium]
EAVAPGRDAATPPPSAGAAATPRGDVRAGSAGPAPAPAADAALVPDLARRTARGALLSLARVGLRPGFEGTGVVVGQDPPPGALLPRGSRVRVILERPGQGAAGRTALRTERSSGLRAAPPAGAATLARTLGPAAQPCAPAGPRSGSSTSAGSPSR